MHLLQEEDLYEDAIALAKELAAEDPDQFSSLVESAEKALVANKERLAQKALSKSDEDSDSAEEKKEEKTPKKEHVDPIKAIEDPLIELLEKRKEKKRFDVLHNIKIMSQVNQTFQKFMRFEKLRHLVVEEVYKQD